MDRIEKRILEIIDQNAKRICAFGADIRSHAELGFQEVRTSAKFQEELDKLGLAYEKDLAITGVKAYLKDKQEGEIRVALMGEYDALSYPDHPEANPETGAAHLCGHDAQITGVMGAAIALADPEIMDALDGNVVFIGVPSEEASTSPAVKEQLLAEGKIHYLGGKCELIHIGAMDDVDITVGTHVNGTVGNEDGKRYGVVNAPSMGFVEKYITYTGIAQHPANSYKAIDALSAARLAMNAVDMQREGINKFHMWNTHLLHGFIRSGGRASNIVSDEVQMDYDIRAKTISAIQDIGYRVDRSLRGAAIALGAGMEVKTVPGYLPVCPVKDASIVEEVFEVIDPDHEHPLDILGPDQNSGTTDFGDLSSIMPVFQLYTGGQNGICHDNAFCVGDPYDYFVTPAKCYALMAYRLLKDNAARAKQIIAENKPLMNSQEYRELMKSLASYEKIDMVPVPTEF